MASATAINLTRRDSSILTALFDPESSPSSHIPINPSLPPLPYLPSNTLFNTLRTREQAAISPLQISSPSPSAIATAQAELDTIIAQASTYASAYMNRAQTRRLAVPAEGLFGLDYAEETSAIFEDLRKAIDLASPRSPHDELSPHQKDILAASHTHRGFLLMRAAEVSKSAISTGQDPRVYEVLQRLPRTDAEGLEELAARDFMLGARYGNKEAQQMSVRTNPYAKMCGAIVKEALRKEVEGAGQFGL